MEIEWRYVVEEPQPNDPDGDASRANGTKLTIPNNHPAEDASPVLSSYGSTIAVYSNRDGNGEI